MNTAAMIGNLILGYLVENTYSLSGETCHTIWFLLFCPFFYVSVGFLFKESWCFHSYISVFCAQYSVLRLKFYSQSSKLSDYN